MNNLKKIILILLVILLIIFVIILGVYKNMQKVQDENIIDERPDVSEDFIKELGKVEGYSTFFSVEKMLNNYIKSIRLGDAQAVYNLTDNSYISENNINKENILKNLKDISSYSSELKIREMYESTNDENANYYIKCILEKDNKGKEFYFTLYTDETNSTYSIMNITKETYDKNITENNSQIQEKRIEANEDNKKVYLEITEEQRAKKYFEDIIDNILYYPEYAYSLLDAEYRNKCFPTFQDFQDYIEGKKDILKTYDLKNLKSYSEFENMDEYLAYIGTAKNLELKSYQIRMNKEYNRYICIDSEENYYTFYAVSPLNYTVVLDNYTMPTEDFRKEYDKSSEAKKVVLNIQKFFMGINDKNYLYSYNLLSDTFKVSKYPTKEVFINYVKDNLFEKNEIEYKEYQNENGLYIYKIKITDATRKNPQEKTFNIIVKLNEGTDFEMSFGEE